MKTFLETEVITTTGNKEYSISSALALTTHGEPHEESSKSVLVTRIQAAHFTYNDVYNIFLSVYTDRSASG
jgi:hypothetical protein